MSNILQPNKVVVNSVYKQVGETNDDFTITLPNSIQNIKSVAFNTVIFPNSMLPFKGAEYGANQNNLLNFTHDVGGTPSTFNITVPTNKVFADGDDLALWLQGELNSGGRSGYTVVFSLEDGASLTIANATFNFSINVDTTPRGWGKMGFITQRTNVATATGDENINLIRTSVVSVHSNIADGDVLTSIDQDRYDIAVLIPVSTTYGGVITLNSSNDRVISEQINGIQTISIVLRDEEGDKIGLATSSHFQAELAIEYNELTKNLGRSEVRAPLPTMTGSFFQQ